MQGIRNSLTLIETGRTRESGSHQTKQTAPCFTNLPFPKAKILTAEPYLWVPGVTWRGRRSEGPFSEWGRPEQGGTSEEQGTCGAKRQQPEHTCRAGQCGGGNVCAPQWKMQRAGVFSTQAARIQIRVLPLFGWVTWKKLLSIRRSNKRREKKVLFKLEVITQVSHEVLFHQEPLTNGSLHSGQEHELCNPQMVLGPNLHFLEPWTQPGGQASLRPLRPLCAPLPNPYGGDNWDVPTVKGEYGACAS